MAAPKLNVVYMHSHDTGRYIQPYGFGTPTPKMQNLAEEGVLFRQAFTVNPTCSPSRAALLTGQYAHSCGMFGLVNRGWTHPDPKKLLQSFLKSHGYETVLAGIQHVVKNPEDGGWTKHGGKRTDVERCQQAVDFIKGPHDKPFFLDIGYITTHRIGRGFPDQPPGEEPSDPRWLRPPAPFADNARTREDMALYVNSVRLLDQLHGRVLDAIDDAGLRENTLVVCTTDHGLAFPHMKCNLNDHGCGVMLILRGPGFNGGQVLDGMVTHLDIFPTVCEALGLEPPSYLQGKSLQPLANGTVDDLHDEVFAEVNYHAAYEPKRSVRTKRYRYARRYDGRNTSVPSNCDASISKDEWNEHGWKSHPDLEETLFDLQFDPNEACNLAGDPQHQAVLKDLRERLDRWMKETGDPLVDHPYIEPCATAMVNDPDDAEPKNEAVSGPEWIAKKYGKG